MNLEFMDLTLGAYLIAALSVTLVGIAKAGFGGGVGVLAGRLPGAGNLQPLCGDDGSGPRFLDLCTFVGVDSEKLGDVLHLVLIGVVDP